MNAVLPPQPGVAARGGHADAEEIYDKVLEVLCRHLSAVHARSLLSRGAQAIGLRHRHIALQDLPTLVARIERAAALFLKPDKRAALARDLGMLWRRDRVEAETIAVRSEDDIVTARSRAREMCTVLGARKTTGQKVATVVSELARNIALYTPGGQVELIPQKSPSRVVIVATDSGTGIPHLDEVLSGNYQSRTGLGCGLLGTKRVANGFDINTGPAGTRVRVEIHL